MQYRAIAHLWYMQNVLPSISLYLLSAKSKPIYLLVHLDNHPSIHPSLHISSFSSFSTSLFSVHSAIHASIGSCFNPLICSFICSGIPAFTCPVYTVIPCLLFLANSILTILDCKSKLHQAHISKTNQIKQWQSWGIDQSNLKGQLAWEWVLH